MAPRKAITKDAAPHALRLWSDDGFLTGAQANELADLMATGTGNIIQEVYENLLSHIDKLAAKVTAMESKSLAYRGTWKSSMAYPAGSLVSHSGSMWLSEAPTSQRPGNGPTSWTLVVKAKR